MHFATPTLLLAFSLSVLASTPPAWSAPAPATDSPILPRVAKQGNAGVSPASGTRKYFADAFCTPYQKLVERIAWSDALQYAQALASWQPNGSFQPAMDLYMGNDSRGPLGATLRANIDGAVRVHDLSTWPDTQKLFVFCDEPTVLAKSGGLCDMSGTIAYAFNLNGTYYDNHYVVFCPRYYNSPSLSQALSIADALLAPKSFLKAVAEDFVGNKGEVYFHESLHFADLTTPVNHPIVDSNGHEPNTYGPHDVVLEAESKNTAACLHIADAYSCAAAAIFAQQHYNLADPPKPLMEDLSRRNLGSHFRAGTLALRKLPQLPDPDTPDNYIAMNDFRIGPIAPIIQNTTESLSSRPMVPGSSSLLRRVAWPPRFLCTPENGCKKSTAATIASTVSGPLICFLVAGLCVLSLIL